MIAAVEFTRDPHPTINRRQYKFMVQTKYLSERQIFAEAFLRGIVSGEREEVVSNEQKKIIDTQLRCDFEKWIQGGQDLTPIFMNHRASVDEVVILMTELWDEINRLETSRASSYAIGVQLEFAISCLKRTIVAEPDECEQIQNIVDRINAKYIEICTQIERNSRQTMNNSPSIIPNAFSSPMSGYYTAQPMNVPMNVPPATYVIPQYLPQPSAPYITPQNLRYPGPQQIPVPMNYQSPNNRQVPMNPQVNQSIPVPSFERSNIAGSQMSMLNGRGNSSLVGPHKVSATIISIIGKNIYEPQMDALDQILLWECQAKTLQLPIEYFLSYMEILLSKDIQVWWQLHRSQIHSWEQFKKQFIEDFGDHNRVIKAEQEIASLRQKPEETFQQLFLRFTKLMSRVKPEKSETDKLYILRSSLKPDLRSACMSVTTITDLKRLCQEYEGMQKMYSVKESKQRSEQVCVIEKSSPMEIDDFDYWNNEIDFTIMDEEERILVINENLQSRKIAMSNSWTKEQKKDWLSKQICWNCDAKGHLQGQCDKNWTPHCVKCGNKTVRNSKECPKCSGNTTPSVSGGARQ